MISYTDTAKAVWQAGLQKQLTLVIDGTTTLTNSDILMESMSLRQSCNEESQFAIGNVYSSEFTVSVFNDAPASEYVGKTIVPTLTAVDSEGNLYPQKLGEFEIASAKLTSNRIHRELVCYDKLSPILQTDYSNWYNSLSFPMTIKYIRDAFFAFVGITQETITLPNDNIQVELTYPFETLSGADLLRAICQVNGAWGFMDYDGKFKYSLVTKVTDNMLYPSETLYPSEVLFPGGTISISGGGEAYQGERNYVQGSLAFEEFKTSPITAVTVTQTTGEISVTSGTDGNTFTITENMLLYFVGESVMQTVADNLLANLEGLTYVPVSVKTAPTPWVEIGDWVCFECDNEILYFPVMQRTFAGITAVMDNFTATGTEYIQENANSVEARVASVEATARETGNYFWVDDDGAHVTQVPKSDIVADGWEGIYNSLITSTEFQVRYGDTPLATFGEEVVIGNAEESALHLTSDSVSGYGEGDKFFFSISGSGSEIDVPYNFAYTMPRDLSARYMVTLPSSFNSTSSTARLTYNWVSGGMPTGVDLGTITYGTSASPYQRVTIGGVQRTFLATYDGSRNTVNLGITPYDATLDNLYPITFHAVYTSQEPAPSYVFGGECDATGAYSFVTGFGNAASADYQTVVGQYNANDPDNVFEVGYGSSAVPRNVFEVSNTGEVKADGFTIPKLKSLAISGTTSTGGNIDTGLTINDGVVVGFQSGSSSTFMFIPFCRSDGKWYLHCMTASTTHNAQTSASVSGTVYYLAQ